MINGTIVLTGATGILGSTFLDLLRPHKPVCFGRIELSDPEAARRKIAECAPALVINCAADTDVEGAEADPERAFAVNAALAGTVARGAADAGARLVHFSSTGCYGDWKRAPYTEDDPLRPTTVHHKSKAAGEEEVMRASSRALIVRLGWLFGGRTGQRKNFVWARLSEAAGKDEIGSNPAQFGCPTFAVDVVRQVLALVQGKQTGVFNCVGGGAPANRLDYVTAILKASGSRTRVVPVVFSRRAPVSANEAAINQRLQSVGLDVMGFWRESLETFVHSLTIQLSE